MLRGKYSRGISAIRRCAALCPYERTLGGLHVASRSTVQYIQYRYHSDWYGTTVPRYRDYFRKWTEMRTYTLSSDRSWNESLAVTMETLINNCENCFFVFCLLYTRLAVCLDGQKAKWLSHGWLAVHAIISHNCLCMIYSATSPWCFFFLNKWTCCEIKQKFEFKNKKRYQIEKINLSAGIRSQNTQQCSPERSQLSDNASRWACCKQP